MPSVKMAITLGRAMIVCFGVSHNAGAGNGKRVTRHRSKDRRVRALGVTDSIRHFRYQLAFYAGIVLLSLLSIST